MVDNIHGTFISHKVNKVRWKPEGNLDSETFLTGSWDNDINELTLWMYPPLSEEEDLDLYPCHVHTQQHEGSVTEIKFVDNSRFVVSSSLGSVKLLRIVDRTEAASTHFSELIAWDNIHYFMSGDESPCTGLATFDKDIASIGEDGRIVLLTAHQQSPVAVVDDADSCSLRCVIFLKHNELLTGNHRGQMKVWDLRSRLDKPEHTFMLSGDQQVGASCITQHPTQQHLILQGGDDGSITVWDLRHNNVPVTLMSAHSQAVSELQFHPDRPEHVFTCSLSGELWHWDTTAMTRLTAENIMEENPWLSGDVAKHRMEVFSLMQPLHLPVNSLDVNQTRLVCGCDNEAVYVIKNILL